MRLQFILSEIFQSYFIDRTKAIASHSITSRCTSIFGSASSCTIWDRRRHRNIQVVHPFSFDSTTLRFVLVFHSSFWTDINLSYQCIQIKSKSSIPNRFFPFIFKNICFWLYWFEGFSFNSNIEGKKKTRKKQRLLTTEFARRVKTISYSNCAGKQTKDSYTDLECRSELEKKGTDVNRKKEIKHQNRSVHIWWRERQREERRDSRWKKCIKLI